MTQKTPTLWLANSAAYANVWTYNQTGITYNQVGLTYSGIVVGQNFIDTKIPTVWSTL